MTDTLIEKLKSAYKAQTSNIGVSTGLYLALNIVQNHFDDHPSEIPVLSEKICDDCSGHNPVWFAPNALWNLVMGGPDANGDPGGCICPVCFIKRAEAAGQLPTGWELRPEVIERESGWHNMKTNPPGAREECLIWLKPSNGNGDSEWSVRKGCFRDGKFSEWGENANYQPETYARITHWRPYMDEPPIKEIEDGQS